MTINDIYTSQALVNIPMVNSIVAAALRRGDLKEAEDEAEKLDRHVADLLQAIRKLKEVFREPMGS